MNRRSGRLAVDVLRPEGAATYQLNTGSAYGGELWLTGPMRLRLSQPGDELVMLREHDRARVIGAWTGVQVDGRSVVASGVRFGDTVDAREQKSLFDQGLLRAASIGFAGRWRTPDELQPLELLQLAAEGADLERIRSVIDDVEVYEASLVAVGADELARWSMDGGEGEDEGESEGAEVPDYARMMIAHLIVEHDFTEADAIARVLGPSVGPLPLPMPPADAPAEPAPVEDAALAAGVLFAVPAAIRGAAQQGLDWRTEYRRGGTPSGVRTARALASGRVDPELLLTIRAWWARFSQVEGPMEDGAGRPTPLAIARALWGGDTAQAWAEAHEAEARAEIDGADGEMTARCGVLHLLTTGPAAPGIAHLLHTAAR
jgi:hypothetical protein